eukprot:TRINITY_DN24_c0_g1_i9.p2 TRINITY_DN24_c0_g1~~TRINITY_DN24_c0_g1_i9.p2  ORF type:complete len:76 (+),score=9.34 TRINITY_DN24_c0_g1_i9:166-393(+)
MNGIVSSVSSNAFFQSFKFFHLSYGTTDVQACRNRYSHRSVSKEEDAFLESSGDSLSVFLGEDVPQDFPLPLSKA